MGLIVDGLSDSESCECSSVLRKLRHDSTFEVALKQRIRRVKDRREMIF